MTPSRPSFPAALAALALLATLAEAAPGDAVKKMQAAVAKLAQEKGAVAADDARLAEADAAFDAVAKEGGADAAKALMQLMAAPFPSATVEVFMAEHARDALVALEPGPGRDEVRSTLDKKKKDIRMVVPLAQVVSAWKEPASVAPLAALLEQKDDRVVMAGARGLGALERKEGVKPLIAAFGALREAGGEPLEAVGNALYAITGQAFKTPEDWLKWWEPLEASWDPSQKQKDTGGGTKTRHFQPKDPPDMFESMQIKSKKVVIILDVSGSMHIRNYIEEATEGPARPAEAGGTSTDKAPPAGGGTNLGAPPLPPGVTPGAPGYKPKKCIFGQCPGAKGTGPECPSDENLPIYYSRMERLKRQVERTIRSFQPSVRFNLVVYSTDARQWQKGSLVDANEKNKRSAIDFIQGQQANGATSADKAIDLAFTVEEADTFVFVTDGAPTNPAGRPYDEGRWRELLDEVKRKNKVRKVKIDVIAIAEGHTNFARGLAAENGGQYVTVP